MTEEGTRWFLKGGDMDDFSRVSASEKGVGNLGPNVGKVRGFESRGKKKKKKKQRRMDLMILYRTGCSACT